MKDELSERLEVYIEALGEADCGENTLRIEAEEAKIPIIRKSAERYLRLFLKVLKPKRILEIGTATGFSAVVMAEATDAFIDTVEKDEKRASEAKELFLRRSLSDRIEVFCEDAGDFLASSDKKYDFIFLDAAKGQYMTWLSLLKEHLACGGALMADNVLQEGSVLDSRYAVVRRDRTIHERMRSFVKAVYNDDDFDTDILPVGDGLLVARRAG